MKDALTISDVELPITDDPIEQQMAILRTVSLHVKQNDLAGRVGMMAGKMKKTLARAQHVNNWEAHLAVLALAHVLQNFCEQIYVSAIEAQAKALAAEEAVDAKAD